MKNHYIEGVIIIKTILVKANGQKFQVYSAEEVNNKICVIFNKDGKKYYYNKQSIEILENKRSNFVLESYIKGKLPFTVYTFKKECFRCHGLTNVITYIKYKYSPYDDLTYPWDINRLTNSQIIFAHIMDPSIEYFGLRVIGNLPKFDSILMNAFPDRIDVRYSNTTKTSYPMNLCEHCGTPQGNYYIYRQVNEMIDDMQQIDILEYTTLEDEK